MSTTIPRPLPPDAIASLATIAEACDVLHAWGHPDIADRLAYFASDADLEDGDVPLTLESAQGFLAFFGAVANDGQIRITCTQEGWLCAEWEFDDKRDAGLWFLDADRIMFTATDRSGKFIDISGGSNIAPRKVITKKLASEGIFVCL